MNGIDVSESRLEMLKRRFKIVLQWFKSEFIWPLSLLIIAVSLFIIFISAMDYRGYATPGVLKVTLEVVHPLLLIGFVLVSLWGWLARKNTVSKYMTILGGAFFIREIHFDGSDYLMAIIIILLLRYVWMHPDRLNDLWGDRWALSLLVLCIISYFCSEIVFDRHLLQQPFELYYRDEDWDLPYSSNIEESLETLGGSFLLASGLRVAFTHR